jgi:hypothetical protein
MDKLLTKLKTKKPKIENRDESTYNRGETLELQSR